MLYDIFNIYVIILLHMVIVFLNIVLYSQEMSLWFNNSTTNIPPIYPNGSALFFMLVPFINWVLVYWSWVNVQEELGKQEESCVKNLE